MKYFILLSLLSTPALAVKFVKQEASPLGSFSEGFEITKDKASYARTSNAFDQRPDYRIGVFELPVREGKSAREKLEKFVEKLDAVDKFLRKDQGMSLNEVAGSPGHKQVFVLAGYMIPPESKHFAELEGIFKELKEKNWKHVSGYEISEDLSKVTEIVSGKVKRSIEYPKTSYCDRNTSVCTYHGGGKLLVPKL